MSTPLVPGLSFGPNNSPLPQGDQLLLITDHLPSPADFILHRALAIHLKNSSIHPHRVVVLVSLASEFAHWRAIAGRSNVNLAQHMKAGSLMYIDGLSIAAYQGGGSAGVRDTDEVGYVKCPPFFGTSSTGGGQEPPPSLKGLHDLIAQSLANHGDELPVRQHTVIVDDITLLELIGVPTIVITRFIRALRALCLRHSAALIIRAHASPLSNAEMGTPFDSVLLRTLIDASHVHVEVRPLASGRSGAVSGEIAVHRGGLGFGDSVGGGEVSEGRGRGVQYRLTDGGVNYFQKGMAAGVL